jgi:hypothetical protein
VFVSLGPELQKRRVCYTPHYTNRRYHYEPIDPDADRLPARHDRLVALNSSE